MHDDDALCFWLVVVGGERKMYSLTHCSPLIFGSTRRMNSVLTTTTQQKAAAATRLIVYASSNNNNGSGAAKAASVATTTTRMAKHDVASSSLSPSSSQNNSSTYTSTLKQQQQQQQPQQQQQEPHSYSINNESSASASASARATTTNGAATANNKLSKEFSKRYRNNPHRVLPIEVVTIVHSNSNSNNNIDTTVRTRNEQLIQSAIVLCPELVLSTLPKLYDQSACYYWRFTASPLKKEEQVRDHDDNHTASWVVFISVWSASTSLSFGNECDDSIVTKTTDATKFMTPLHIRPLEGGLSNLLYVVENPCAAASTTGLMTSSSTKTTAAPRSVLVRIHPSGDDDVVNREYENKLLAWLSRRHHSPANNNHSSSNLPVPVFYGRFFNGRVEEFYDNVRPLTCHEMATYARDTARLMARMHCTTLQQQQQHQALGGDHDEVDGRNDKNHNADADADPCPLLYKTLVLKSRGSYTGDIVPRVNAWFKRLDHALLLLLNANHPSPSTPPSGSSLVRMMMMMMSNETNSLAAVVGLLKNEWQWLQSKLFHHDKKDDYCRIGNTRAARPTTKTTTTTITTAAARDFCRQVVLTHMDAQSLNLLVPTNSDSNDNAGQDKNNNNNGPGQPNANNNNANTVVAAAVDMKLIDFEYAGFNPRAADIANTFCEHCDMNNLRAKWQEEYPTLQQQEYFVRAYLDELVALFTSSSSSASTVVTCKHDDDSSNSILQQNYINKSDEDKKEFVTALCHEIGRYTLVSHLSWAVWSCVQHVNRCNNNNNSSSSSTNNASTSNSGCNDAINNDDDDFDYLAYARHRIDGYRYFQERFMSNLARI